jgi:hypothetical protein
LFAAIHGKEPEDFNRRTPASRDGIKIRFTGMQPDRAHPPGNASGFGTHGFLRALDLNTGRPP